MGNPGGQNTSYTFLWDIRAVATTLYGHLRAKYLLQIIFNMIFNYIPLIDYSPMTLRKLLLG